jgi:hypothetical protein
LFNHFNSYRKRKLFKIETTDVCVSNTDEVDDLPNLDIEPDAINSPNNKKTRIDEENTTDNNKTTPKKILISKQKQIPPVKKTIANLNNLSIKSPVIHLIPMNNQLPGASDFEPPTPPPMFDEPFSPRTIEKTENQKYKSANAVASPKSDKESSDKENANKPAINKPRNERKKLINENALHMLNSGIESDIEDLDFNESELEMNKKNALRDKKMEKNKPTASKTLTRLKTSHSSSTKTPSTRASLSKRLAEKINDEEEEKNDDEEEKNDDEEENSSKIYTNQTMKIRNKSMLTPVQKRINRVIDDDEDENEPEERVDARILSKLKEIDNKNKKNIKKLASSSESSDSSDEEKYNFKKKDKSSASAIPKRRAPWTDQETLYLVMGVLRFGKGSWVEIIKSYPDAFSENSRENVHLKDRYRTIEKNGELKCFEKRAQQKIKELKND